MILTIISDNDFRTRMKSFILLSLTLSIIINDFNCLKLASENENFVEDKFQVFHRTIKFQNAVVEEVFEFIQFSFKIISKNLFN